MSALKRARGLCAVLLVVVRTIHGQDQGSGTLSLTVALVDDHFQVHPLALYQIGLFGLSDSSPLMVFKTGLDGKVQQTVRAGTYRVRGLAPAPMSAKRYTWNVQAFIPRGRTLDLSLTNDNATVDSSGTVASTPSHEIAPETEVFERVKTAVVRVDAGLGHGSGFILDTLGGIVITNGHVVQGETDISVLIDSLTRVPAQVLIADQDLDLAVLRFDMQACPHCYRLRMATPDSAGRFVVPGERVIAIGFPLSQQATVTSGIVSSVRDRAIMSDVNINPGNSGGPLLNAAGDVVGVNTFIDADQQRGLGAGVSGSIVISRLSPLLAQASGPARATLPPEAIRLPVEPSVVYPLPTLRQIADSADPTPYGRFMNYGLGNFELDINTPVANLVLARQQEQEVTRDRRKREARANLPEDQRYSDLSSYHDWIEYVGSETAPLVSLFVTPKIGETFGSALLRGLAASQGYNPGQGTYKFKGDLERFQLYRNGEPVYPVIGGKAPQRAFVDNQWVSLKDVAYRGVYVYLPETFAPDSTGAPPSIVVQIKDLKHPDDRNLFELKPEVVARIWNDFGPYDEVRKVHHTMADPRLFHSDFAKLCRQFMSC